MHHVHSNSLSLSLSIYIYVVAKTIHRVDKETQTAMMHVLGCMGGGWGGGGGKPPPNLTAAV